MSLQELTKGTVMKIHVNRVPDEGLKDHAVCDPTELDMERWDIRLPQPFEVDAFITKADAELVVDVDIRCPLRMTCSRCLEEFGQVVTADALFSYQVKPTDVVDITDDVRQEIILAYPMIPVCRADCKGLCSACGQNLNLGPCPHHPGRGEP
ncbi:MAG: DUF177 domain-containing protein [Candidatus Omnitrophica bacterium]|nr:DUF177 domain-containing protein [Candidatus Omnitrophota bacterium]